MNLIFGADEQDFLDCQEAFNQMVPEEALFMSHYELAAESGILADVWKRFLTHHAVSEWLKTEMNLFKATQMKKLIKKATTDSKSVGTAQMINAIGKTMEGTNTKEGPAFIYCYIPLNQDEIHAPNVRIMTHDPFLEDEDETSA